MKEQLIKAAKEARENAYVPYSKFLVGAALLSKSEKIYTGCNIENASYSLTCCAERVAIFQAILNGEKQFKEMAIIADTNRPIPPCGSCRQVMNEFFDPHVIIHMANLKGDIYSISMKALLPFSFNEKDLYN